MGRRLAVRVVAWVLRRNGRNMDTVGHLLVSPDEIGRILQRCYPHRDWTWRAGVLEAAVDRNQRIADRKLASR
jgi:hypothetical protein